MEKEEKLDLLLESILSEFGSGESEAAPPAAEASAPAKLPEPEEAAAASEAEKESPAAETSEAAEEPAASEEEPETAEKSDLVQTRVLEIPAKEEAEKAEPGMEATRVLEFQKQEPENTEEQAQRAARSRLQILKSKLVAGPEKRYYDLSEQGVAKLQAAIALGSVVTAACLIMAVLFELDMIPASRMRFMVFSQVLAMLVSAFLGSELMVDSIAELAKKHFTPNFLLVPAFLACAADAVMSLAKVRVPCCGAFSLSMTFALLGSYYDRVTEMSQMDTLRKATKLIGLSRRENYLNGKAAILRGEGEPEDMLDTYRTVSGPQKVQNIFSLAALLLSLAIGGIGFIFSGVSVGLQALSGSLMLAVPASAFIALKRPAHLLEKRLHLVGTVLCGWQGVKTLKAKAHFPITDYDLFPAGTTKLNGVKFYGTRRPEDVIAYTGSIIVDAESPLSPLFVKEMENRRCAPLPVLNFQEYDIGYRGEVRGETVLVGPHDFMTAMGVEIPSGTVISQGLYAAISGKLAAVYALNYAKMRSAAAGLVSARGCKRIMPVVLCRDVMINGDFIHGRFGIRTDRMYFPSGEEKMALLSVPADAGAPVAALTTRTDLISAVSAVSGASALDASCRMGLWLSMVCAAIGLLIMAALAYLGSSELLTPLRFMLYELIWLVPAWLVTEWTRTV